MDALKIRRQRLRNRWWFWSDVRKTRRELNETLQVEDNFPYYYTWYVGFVFASNEPMCDNKLLVLAPSTISYSVLSCKGLPEVLRRGTWLSMQDPCTKFQALCGRSKSKSLGEEWVEDLKGILHTYKTPLSKILEDDCQRSWISDFNTRSLPKTLARDFYAIPVSTPPAKEPARSMQDFQPTRSRCKVSRPELPVQTVFARFVRDRCKRSLCNGLFVQKVFEPDRRRRSQCTTSVSNSCNPQIF